MLEIRTNNVAHFITYGGEGKDVLLLQERRQLIEYARLANGRLEPHKFETSRMEPVNTERPKGRYSPEVLYNAIRAFAAAGLLPVKNPAVSHPAWELTPQELDVVFSYANGIAWRREPSLPAESQKDILLSPWNFEADNSTIWKVRHCSAVTNAYSVYKVEDCGTVKALKIRFEDAVIAEASGKARPIQTRGLAPDCGLEFLEQFLGELLQRGILPRDASFGWNASAEQHDILRDAIRKVTVSRMPEF